MKLLCNLSFIYIIFIWSVDAMEDALKPAKECPPNQVWNPCSKPCPPETTCETYISGIVYDCARPIDEEESFRRCTPACQCDSGFVRKVTGGDCIKPETCCDDPNAEVVDCPNPCPGGTCESPTFADCKAPCKFRGCQCKKGYVKDANGKCILLSMCPNDCKDNEVWNPCVTYCTFDDTCEMLMEGIVPDCAAPPENWQCPAKCECPKGFVRIGEECLENSACCEDPFAEFVPCPNPCPGGTCEQPEFSPCKMMCKPWGCQCKKGYVKDSNGKCIPQSSCEKKCNENEVWNPCPRYCTFDDTCESLMYGYIRDCMRPPPDWKCTGRCECRPGFVKINGYCEKPIKCCADPNAVFVQCPSPCPGGTCDQPEFSPCKIKCNPWGCQCKKGYVKDSNGKCILKSSCSKKCGENEVWNPCPQFCTFDDTCESLMYGWIRDCTTPSEDWQCTGRCECDEGFVRIDGNCVNTAACCTDPNAEFVQCPNPCPGGTCDQPEFSPCKIKCNPWGCQCKKGYVKDSNGICILKSSCPKKCGENEVWNPCPKFCTFDDTCESLMYGWIRDCTTPSEDWQCTGRCECDEGFVRIDGNCVNPAACCTDPNAEFVQCPNPCPGGTCDQPEFTPCKMMCNPWGCQCKKGYVKDSNGICILKSFCPKKCGVNEVWNPCPQFCTFDDTCESLMYGWIRDCTTPSEDWQCTGRCECDEGFVRIEGNCVNPAACCTDPNAEFVKCPNPCPGGTCDQPEFSPCKMMCKPWGCQCKKGYVKDNNGKCIPISSCCCTDPNAEFVQCPNPCPGGTCEQPEFSPCKMMCIPWGCQCKKGYVKDNNGKCIPISSCPKKCGPNEFFDCGSACDTTCATLGEPCKIINKKCVDRCYCNKAYARDKKNVCIPIKSCPRKFSCGKNEEYVACPSNCPPERTCDFVFSGIEPLCPVLLNPPNCKPQCRCKSGYVRNAQKKCVLPAACCTDPNSQLVDNANCCPGGTCANPSFMPCKMKCPAKGCQCKPGFLKKSDKDKTCINKKLCPPTLKPVVSLNNTKDPYTSTTNQ